MSQINALNFFYELHLSKFDPFYYLEFSLLENNKLQSVILSVKKK